MLPKADCIIWLTVTLALAIATVTLNFIAISIFTKHRNFRNRNAYLLINLAVADMLVGGFCTVNEFYYYGWFCNIWRSDWPRYVSFMRLAVFYIFLVSSLTNITVISLERLHATLWPFKHRVLKLWIYKIVITFVWILAGFISFVNVALINFGKWSDYVYFWNSYNAFCLLVIWFSYALIFFKVHLGFQVLHHGAAARERRLTVTLFIVTILSLALWLPYIVNIFVNYSTDYATLLPGLMYFHLESSFILFFHTNSLVNPILYLIRIPGFRRAAIALFKSRCRQQRQIQVFPLREV